MIKLTLILSFVIISTGLNSQTIADLFVELPDSSVLNLKKEYREKLVRNYNISKDDKENESVIDEEIFYKIEVLDIKNGFLKVGGAIEGHIDICYWNLQDKSKMIAVYQEGCGPGCFVEKFDFYNYKNKIFTPLNYKKVIPITFEDFLSGDIKTVTREMEKADIAASLLYDLPQKGKNIIAKWGNIEPDNKYRKYAKGNRMVLQWNNGTFKKGVAFWK
jgi:hypothetical protein